MILADNKLEKGMIKMRKIIGGKVYDTDTATYIDERDNGRGFTDHRFLRQELYRKRTGEYFLYGEGGGLTPHADTYGDSMGWGEEIIPFSYEQARTWAEVYSEPEVYEQEFEVKDEDYKILPVKLPQQLYDTLKKQAEEDNKTLKEFIVDKVKEG